MVIVKSRDSDCLTLKREKYYTFPSFGTIKSIHDADCEACFPLFLEEKEKSENRRSKMQGHLEIGSPFLEDSSI